ncbi:MAG: 1-(5-phosphoribosyl)-5-[(5-phosphoribosylamino)methylideneamino]imidazole-4-carboxamide isomerase [Bacteroidota bacterium]
MTRIIPAIDLIDGKCVRLEEGDYDRKKVYNEDPLEVAKEFADHGIRHLHLVDLDGAKAGEFINWKVLNAIATQTDLRIDVGGGIKTDNDLRIVLENGANQVNVGSLAVKNPMRLSRWLEQYGGEKIILSADARDEKVAIHGWQTQTELDLLAFLTDYVAKGIQTAVVTDIARDGMLAGPAFDLYEKIQDHIPDLKLVASGGVSSMADVAALIQQKLDGIIIGKAIYEGRISLGALAKQLS